MIDAVLHTNVLASGFLGRGGTPDLILRRWDDGEFELIVSEPILRELDRTRRKPYFRRQLGEERIAAALRDLRDAAIVVASPPLPEPVATHSADDLILSTAVTAQASYLVTGDAQLQALGRYRDVTILSPRESLTLLESGVDEARSAVIDRNSG